MLSLLGSNFLQRSRNWWLLMVIVGVLYLKNFIYADLTRVCVQLETQTCSATCTINYELGLFVQS